MYLNWVSKNFLQIVATSSPFLIIKKKKRNVNLNTTERFKENREEMENRLAIVSRCRVNRVDGKSRTDNLQENPRTASEVSLYLQ